MPPGTRLIWIYLITVLVAGGILSYLSINSISNFQELTEKRILEQEASIAQDYSLQFDTLLRGCANDLQMRSDMPHERTQRSKPLYSLGVDSAGRFVKPVVLQVSDMAASPQRVSVSGRVYQKAEHNEFVLKKYSSASSQYQEALRLSHGPQDSLKAFNALARVAAKSGDLPEALAQYRNVIHYSVERAVTYGPPYAYFAMTQALAISDQNNKDVDSMIVDFVKGIYVEQLPYAPGLTGILDEIDAHVKGRPESLSELSLEKPFKQVRRISRGIELYRSSLIEAASGSIPGEAFEVDNLFVLDNRIAPDELLVISRDAHGASGFVFQIEELHAQVLNSVQLTRSGFDYSAELIEAPQVDLPIRPDLAVHTGISPYYESKHLRVALANSEDLEKYILKRKVATATGLILLLGALCIGFITLYRDVKRRKKIEQFRRDFVSNITHELKTPLTSINMLADTIALGRIHSADRLQYYAQTIVKESERLKRMVNNILDFSRSENDKLTYVLKTCNVATVIHQVMNELDYWLQRNHFEYSMDLDESVLANADTEALEQVISNLVVNAIKYSGSIRKIHLRLYRQADWAIIEVRDWGIGISTMHQARIFDKFYRIENPNGNPVGGTGLGLTVSKDIVEAMNGAITVQSAKDEGSTFSIKLPTSQ